MTATLIPGALQLGWIKAQSAFDTIEAYAATDAVPYDKGTFKIEPTVNFEEKKEASGTFSHQGYHKLDRGGKFSSQHTMRPVSVGVAPDIEPLITSAMGTKTVNGGVSVVWTLSDTSAPAYVQGAINVASHLQHVFSGGFVEEMKIQIPQKGLPTFAFSGQFARFGWAYADVIGTGGVSTGGSSCPLADASRGNFGVGAVVQFVDDTGTASAGYTITDTDNTAGSAHFHYSPNLVGAGESAGGAIVPLVPSQTLTGTVLPGTTAVLTVGGVTLGFLDMTISHKSGLQPRLEAGNDRMVAAMRSGERRTEGEIKCYLLDSNAGWSPFFGGAHEPIERSIALRIGPSTAGGHFDFSIPKAFIHVTPLDIPAADMVTATIKWTAVQSSTAADEFSITAD